jgi:multidrug transporter EmrE-like cation transporter
MRTGTDCGRDDWRFTFIDRHHDAMTQNTLALILISVTLSALAQISFKFGVSAARSIDGNAAGIVMTLIGVLLTPGVILGLLLYGLGTLLWLSALGQVDVSQAYPFVGVGFVLTSLLGYLFFGDHLGLHRIVGMLIVIGGVIIVARS